MKTDTLKPGDIFEVVIADTNAEGNGYVRIDGVSVFVIGAAAGDECIVRITSVEKNYAVAEIAEMKKLSGFRTDVNCLSYEKCGGCTLSHLKYDCENRIKKDTVRNAFRRFGLEYGLVEDTVYDERFGYRNKITLHYDKVKKKFGLYSGESHKTVEFSGCMLCPDEVNHIICAVNRNIALIEPYNPESLAVRTSSDNVTVTLSTEKKISDIKVFEEKLRSVFDNISVVYLTGGEKSSQFLRDDILGLKMRYSTEAFRQVNKKVFERLLGIVIEMAGECRFVNAADLYCGSGIIGLVLAKHYPDSLFTGIEINPEAVDDAKFNAKNNDITNIRFFCGDAATFITRTDVFPDLLVADPPRAGMSDKMRNDIVTLNPENIIYVSCNPNTLARDISDLRENGYRIKRAVPVNMFACCPHVETVCLLTKN